MSKYTLKNFYDFLNVDGYYLSMNIIDDKGVFSWNTYATDFKVMEDYASANHENNCYVSYNLMKPTNEFKKRRNFASLGCMNVVAFDIEFGKKKAPETEKRLEILKRIIEEKIIKKFKLKKFMINCSGNGYHLFAPFMTPTTENFDKAKPKYKHLVYAIQTEVNAELKEKFEISCTDRVEIGGILRIPTTKNHKANRMVEIVDIQDNGKNKELSQKYDEIVIKERVKKSQDEVSDKKFYNKIPTNEEEFENHPFVKIWLNEDLPDDSDKHTTLVFALQILARECDVPRSEINDIASEIMELNGNFFSLDYCSPTSTLSDAYKIFMRWCKEHNFEKYYDECVELLGFESAKELGGGFEDFKKEFFSTPDKLSNRIILSEEAKIKGFESCFKCGGEVKFFDEVGKYDCQKCGDFGGIKKFLKSHIAKKY